MGKRHIASRHVSRAPNVRHQGRPYVPSESQLRLRLPGLRVRLHVVAAGQAHPDRQSLARRGDVLRQCVTGAVTWIARTDQSPQRAWQFPAGTGPYTHRAALAPSAEPASSQRRPAARASARLRPQGFPRRTCLFRTGCSPGAESADLGGSSKVSYEASGCEGRIGIGSSNSMCVRRRRGYGRRVSISEYKI